MKTCAANVACRVATVMQKKHSIALDEKVLETCLRVSIAELLCRSMSTAANEKKMRENAQSEFQQAERDLKELRADYKAAQSRASRAEYLLSKELERANQLRRLYLQMMWTDDANRDQDTFRAIIFDVIEYSDDEEAVEEDEAPSPPQP